MKSLQLNKTENGHRCVDVCIFDMIEQWIKNIYYIYREKGRVFFYSINVFPILLWFKEKLIKNEIMVLVYNLFKENIRNLFCHRIEGSIKNRVIKNKMSCTQITLIVLTLWSRAV